MGPNPLQRPVLPSLESLPHRPAPPPPQAPATDATAATHAPQPSSSVRRFSVTEPLGMHPPQPNSASPVGTPPHSDALVPEFPGPHLTFQKLKFVQNDGQPHAKRRRISAA